MKESIIVYMEIWLNVFLMPPIPKALRFSFPFLMACEINVNQIKKEIYFLDGIHCVGCKQGRGRMRGPESSGNGNMEESQICLYLIHQWRV